MKKESCDALNKYIYRKLSPSCLQIILIIARVVLVCSVVVIVVKVLLQLHNFR